MKRCTYCGKEHPDDATSCSVDQEALTSCTPPVAAAPEPGPGDERVRKGAAYGSSLTHGLVCLVLSAGFLVLGFVYPLWLDDYYGDPDFRGGPALLLAFTAGLVYGVRAGWCLFHLPERGRS